MNKNISQENLKIKLTRFLRDEKRNLSCIKEFEDSEGFCYGLSLLKLYCDQQPEDQNDINNGLWFKEQVELIADYNKKAFDGLDNKTQEKQKKAIDEFISHVLFMQDVGDYLNGPGSNRQLQAPVVLKDISSKKELQDNPLELVHNLSGNFTQETLQQWLETITQKGLPVGTSILLHMPQHTVNLRYRDNGQYEYYDPNHSIWHIKDTVEEVAQDIFKGDTSKMMLVISQVLCLRDTTLCKEIKSFFASDNDKYDRRILIKSLKLWQSPKEVLTRAILTGDLGLMKDLLAEGYPDTLEQQINDKKINIYDLLMKVGSGGHGELFKFLITKFSKQIAEYPGPIIPIFQTAMEASKNGCVEIIETALLEQMLTQGQLLRCLNEACHYGQLIVIQLLLKHYEFPKDRRESQIDSLFQVALRSENLEVIKWFGTKYFNELDPKSFYSLIKVIKDYKILGWLLDKYPALIEIKYIKEKISNQDNRQFLLSVLKALPPLRK